MKSRIALVMIMCAVTAGSVFGAYQVGDSINDFSLYDGDGNLVNLYDYQGKVIFINFWGSS